MDSKLAKIGHWSQILSFILAFWLAVRPVSSPATWAVAFDRENKTYLLPAAFILSLILAGAFHLAAALVERKKELPEKSGDAKAEADHSECGRTIEELESEVKKLREHVAEPDADLHVECEKRIARLRESEEKHATRASAHESALKEFKKEYFVPLAVADDQKAEIGKCLEVLRVCTLDPKLDDPMPTIKWEIRLKNRSVHRVSLDSEVGPLFFEGHKLTEHKELLENKVMGLYPGLESGIVFEQRLSTSEVNLLKSLPNGKFEFDKVVLYAKRSSPDAEHVPPDRVVILSQFRATLGRCSDERIQAAEELSAEVDSLKAQLIEAKLNSAEDEIAERKALIASWRTLVEKATREYWDTGERGFRFPRILESQEGYMTLSPHLPSETKLALYNARHGEDSDISNLVEMLADDIAQIERDWQV